MSATGALPRWDEQVAALDGSRDELIALLSFEPRPYGAFWGVCPACESGACCCVGPESISCDVCGLSLDIEAALDLYDHATVLDGEGDQAAIRQRLAERLTATGRWYVPTAAELASLPPWTGPRGMVVERRIPERLTDGGARIRLVEDLDRTHEIIGGGDRGRELEQTPTSPGGDRDRPGTPDVPSRRSPEARLQADVDDTRPPLFDLEASKFGRFIESEPPPMEWVLKNLLPADVTGLLGSMGGLGKSQLIYQLGMSVATGAPFLGMEVGQTGGFLYLAAEDDEAELHRRGRRILAHYQSFPNWEPIHDTAVCERLYVVSRAAEDNLLTARRGDGEVGRTVLVDRIAETASLIPNLKVVVFEPVPRFRGGRANDEEDSTRLIEAMEAIKKSTRATVLTAAHVSKAGIREGGGQEVIRGSSALVDGARWVCTLQRMKSDRAQDYGVQKEDARRYIRLEVPKSNYTSVFEGMWLYWDDSGVLVPADLQEREPVRGTEAHYMRVLGNIQGLLTREGPLTANVIETEYAGRDGLLEAGQKSVRGVVQKALHRGDLIKKEDPEGGRWQVVDLPGGG